MLTIKNSAPNTVEWFALPKYGLDIKKALAKGTLFSGKQTTYDPPTTVNILFAIEGQGMNAFAALCSAQDLDATVVFYNEGPKTWCKVTQLVLP